MVSINPGGWRSSTRVHIDFRAMTAGGGSRLARPAAGVSHRLIAAWSAATHRRGQGRSGALATAGGRAAVWGLGAGAVGPMSVEMPRAGAQRRESFEQARCCQRILGVDAEATLMGRLRKTAASAHHHRPPRGEARFLFYAAPAGALHAICASGLDGSEVNRYGLNGGLRHQLDTRGWSTGGGDTVG